MARSSSWSTRPRPVVMMLSTMRRTDQNALAAAGVGVGMRRNRLLRLDRS